MAWGLNFTGGTFSVTSSIDGVVSAARCAFNPAVSQAPVLIAMHSWGGSYASYMSNATVRRWVAMGYFVVTPGMRGDNAGELRDASGKEIYDIYDALMEARRRFRAYASPSKVFGLGYSGGGGNILSVAMRFPDLCAAYADLYGPSDYGYNETTGWYTTDGGVYGAQIAAAVGGTPAEVPNKYRARNAVEGVPANLQGGHLLILHDTGDANVNVLSSQTLVTAMTAAGNSRYVYDETTTGDSPRWGHSNPQAGTSIAAEAIWNADFATREPWTFPASGSCRVHGWLKTGRFEIRLGDLDDHVATVAFDTVAGSYTVTPLTGAMAVTITQGGLTVSATVSEATEIVVS